VNWADSHNQVEVKDHIARDFVDAKTEKVKNLSSNIIFGANDTIVKEDKNF
jgi:hypothetical protein